MDRASAYLEQDTWTDPGPLGPLFDELSRDPRALREIVAGLIMHVAWAANYPAAPQLPVSRDTQTIAERLKLIQICSAGALSRRRGPAQRTFGTCRDYALMLCSMLRHHRHPARVRCGFATYFDAAVGAAPFEDHWICEHWSPAQARWIRSDAQLDEVQRQHLAIAFDAADLPDDAFLSAAQAWRLARSGRVAADAFGHGDARGWWFLRVNVHRDWLTLANTPLSAWDTWREPAARAPLADDAFATVDNIVDLIESVERGDIALALLQQKAAEHGVPPWRASR